MTRFIAFASAAALTAALTGCGAEPAQTSEVAPELNEVPAEESPTQIETVPSAEEKGLAPDPAAASKEATPPEKSPSRAEPKVAVPAEAKRASEVLKPAEPDPHAGHDLD